MMPQIEQISRGVIINNHQISVNWGVPEQTRRRPTMSFHVRGASASPPPIRRSVAMTSDTQWNSNGDIRIIGPRRQGSLVIRRNPGHISQPIEIGTKQLSQCSPAAMTNHTQLRSENMATVYPSPRAVNLQPVNKSIHAIALTRQLKGISIVIGRNEPTSVVHRRDSGSHDSCFLPKLRSSENCDGLPDGSVELAHGLNRTNNSPSSTLSISNSCSRQPVTIAVNGSTPLAVSHSVTPAATVNVSTTLISRSNSLSRCKPPIHHSTVDGSSFKAAGRTFVRISSTTGGGVLVTTGDNRQSQFGRPPRPSPPGNVASTPLVLRATSSYDNLLSKDLHLESLKQSANPDSVSPFTVSNLHCRRLSFGSWCEQPIPRAMPNVPVSSADVGAVMEADCAPHTGHKNSLGGDNTLHTRSPSANDLLPEHRKSPSGRFCAPNVLSDTAVKVMSESSQSKFNGERRKNRSVDQHTKYNHYLRIQLPCTRAASRSKGLDVTDSLKLYEEQILNHYNPYQRPQSWCIDFSQLHNEIALIDDSPSTSPASTVSSNSSSSSSNASQSPFSSRIHPIDMSHSRTRSPGVLRPRVFHWPVKPYQVETTEYAPNEEATTPTKLPSPRISHLSAFSRSQSYQASKPDQKQSVSSGSPCCSQPISKGSNITENTPRYRRIELVDDDFGVFKSTRPPAHGEGSTKNDNDHTDNSFLSACDTVRPRKIPLTPTSPRPKETSEAFPSDCSVPPQLTKYVIKDSKPRPVIDTSTANTISSDESSTPTLMSTEAPCDCIARVQDPNQQHNITSHEDDSHPVNSETLLPAPFLWDSSVAAATGGLVDTTLSVFKDSLPTPVLSCVSSLHTDVHSGYSPSNSGTAITDLNSSFSNLPTPPTGVHLVRSKGDHGPCYPKHGSRSQSGSSDSDLVSTFTDDADDTYAFSTLDSEYLAWMRLSVRDVTDEYATKATSDSTAPLTDLTSLPRTQVHNLVDIFNSNPVGLRLNFVDDSCHLAGTLRIYINLIKPVKMSLRQTMDILPPLPPSPPQQNADNGLVGESPSAIPAQARLVSFFLPRGTSKVVYITSSTTAVNAIQSLLDRFHIQESARKFSLYEHTLKENMIIARKLGPNECPLLVLLNWVRTSPSHDAFVEYLRHTRIVLQENDACDIDWKDFTKAELHNFLRILDKEEAEYRNAILYQYGIVRHHLEDRLNELDREAEACCGLQNYGRTRATEAHPHSTCWHLTGEPDHSQQHICKCDIVPTDNFAVTSV